MKRFAFVLMALMLVPGIASVDRSSADPSVAEPLFVAFHSGKAMDVPGFSHEPGAQIIQWAPHGDLNQQWKLVPFGADTDIYVIVSQESGLALDVEAESTANGAGVVQSAWDGGVSQLWVAVPFSDLIPEGDPDVYIIVSALSGQALDVAGASSADGAELIQWPWHGGLNQIWLRFDGPAET